MDDVTLRRLLDEVATGTVHPDEAVARLRRLPFADVPGARIDHHRHLRQGMPEAVYGPGKRPDQCVAIVGELLAHGDGPILVTRTDDAQRAAVELAHPGFEVHGRTLVWRMPEPDRPQRIVVCSGGTADWPVTEECAVTLRAHGFDPVVLHDVGVAGLHRLLAELDTVTSADAVVTVAGMEGALASVVGGLTGAPVVAVPTSTGYGASLEGVTALLSMLASCASGLAVVGIDNGFGAALAVTRMFPR
ncbi:MAG: nickel pincer cofactor biosynthesis protein LarB [Ilumatobacteraceae bacterium]